MKAKDRKGTDRRFEAYGFMGNGNDPPTIPFPTQEPGELPTLPPEPDKPPQPSPIPIEDPPKPNPQPR